MWWWLVAWFIPLAQSVQTAPVASPLTAIVVSHPTSTITVPEMRSILPMPTSTWWCGTVGPNVERTPSDVSWRSTGLAQVTFVSGSSAAVRSVENARAWIEGCFARDGTEAASTLLVRVDPSATQGIVFRTVVEHATAALTQCIETELRIPDARPFVVRIVGHRSRLVAFKDP
jgi:hypothetical protein